ncbi:MAG TPA: glycosyltransferase family 4 protein [Bacteroidia bacterium]|nr:glycosyltransferase family 4 protein [Bacteroidia bacterium]
MRILQICPKPPLPSVDGGTLAANSVTEAILNSGNEVRVLTIATKKHPFLPGKMSPEYKSATKIEAVAVNTDVNFFSAFFNLFSSSCYNVNRFYSLDFENKLISILQKETFDVIQLESLYMSTYIDAIRKYSKAKIILRAHNVESDLWKRRTLLEKNLLKRRWFNHLTKNISLCETDSFGKVDAIIPITNQDSIAISKMLNGKNKPIFVLPFAMNLPEKKSSGTPKQGTVFHIGSMDWAENIEGVTWLVNEVWPKIISKTPFAELHLAGRGLKADDMRYAGKNIFNHGEVESAEDFMNEFSVMTVPLLSGGGMRVKLVEGMALAKAIVSTSIGAEGTETEKEKEIMIENSAEEFAEAICNLLNNEIFARELGNRAKEFAKSHFDLALSSKKLNDFYGSLIR